jgi:hypothetical protein
MRRLRHPCRSWRGTGRIDGVAGHRLVDEVARLASAAHENSVDTGGGVAPQREAGVVTRPEGREVRIRAEV